MDSPGGPPARELPGTGAGPPGPARPSKHRGRWIQELTYRQIAVATGAPTAQSTDGVVDGGDLVDTGNMMNVS
jgi:hypothetical protein